jgi:hypothetical protein
MADALCGASTVKQMLSSQYYVQMDSFFPRSFKEEAADAQSQGNVDEKTAAPIMFTLYQMILEAIEGGSIPVWMWNIWCAVEVDGAINLG